MDCADQYGEEAMAHIVVLGAGVGGVIMAYEVKEQIGSGDRATAVHQG